MIRPVQMSEASMEQTLQGHQGEHRKGLDRSLQVRRSLPVFCNISMLEQSRDQEAG